MPLASAEAGDPPGLGPAKPHKESIVKAAAGGSREKPLADPAGLIPQGPGPWSQNAPFENQPGTFFF